MSSSKYISSRRLIYVSDPSNTTARVSDPAKPEELREIVRQYAEVGGIDTLVQETWHQGWVSFWRSENCTYDTRPQHQRFIPMMDAGVMPLEVYIDACHEHGMTFMAGFRLNDRHGHNADWFETLSKTKPDWILEGYKPSSPRTADPRSFDIGCALDYSVDAVRDWILTMVDEVANRFDIDGIEFNWHRLPACFPKGQAESSHALMTGFIRQVRETLDGVGRAKGRPLELGARVLVDPQTCKTMGLDLPTWISEKLIDYVAPGDLGFTDMNARFDAFVDLAHAHDCRVYPQIQQKLGYHHRDIEQTPAHCRAAIQNFYGVGADGFSTQNIFQGGQHETLKALRDPDRVRDADRHYVFYPIWGPSDGDQVGYGDDFPYSPEEIRLDRTRPGERETFRFRICEDLSPEPVEAHSAVLTFHANTATSDELRIDINGHTIRPDQIEASPSRDEFPRTTYRFPLCSPPGARGDNELGLAFIHGAPESKDDILMNEVEVYIQAR